MFSKLLTSTASGLLLQLKVTPKAAQNKIGKVMEVGDRSVLKVYVTAAPEQGKANEAVVALLAKAWRLKQSQIVIKHGLTDRNKAVEILGNPDELLEHLKMFLEHR